MIEDDVVAEVAFCAGCHCRICHRYGMDVYYVWLGEHFTANYISCLQCLPENIRVQVACILASTGVS